MKRANDVVRERRPLREDDDRLAGVEARAHLADGRRAARGVRAIDEEGADRARSKPDDRPAGEIGAADDAPAERAEQHRDVDRGPVVRDHDSPPLWGAARVADHLDGDSEEAQESIRPPAHPLVAQRAAFGRGRARVNRYERRGIPGRHGAEARDSHRAPHGFAGAHQKRSSAKAAHSSPRRSDERVRHASRSSGVACARSCSNHSRAWDANARSSTARLASRFFFHER